MLVGTTVTKGEKEEWKKHASVCTCVIKRVYVFEDLCVKAYVKCGKIYWSLYTEVWLYMFEGVEGEVAKPSRQAVWVNPSRLVYAQNPSILEYTIVCTVRLLPSISNVQFFRQWIVVRRLWNMRQITRGEWRIWILFLLLSVFSHGSLSSGYCTFDRSIK